MKKLLFMLFMICTIFLKAQKCPSSLDTSFHVGTGVDNDGVFTTLIQPDGKIIIGGSFNTYNGYTVNRIARLNIDGTLDTNFITGTGVGGSQVSNAVFTSCLQNDGKIIIGGNFPSYNGIVSNYIVRINSNGSLDTTFKTGTGFSGGSTYTRVNTSAVQSDGKIILGGLFNSYNGTITNNIIRLNSNGTLDTSFHTGGGFSGGTLYGCILASAIQGDGKIIIGGTFNAYNGSLKKNIIRLNNDGTIDTTFHPGIGPDSSVYAINIQTNGKITLGGIFNNFNGIPNRNIIRLNADGTLDNSFNIGTTINSLSGFGILAIVMQSDGKIIIGGQFTYPVIGTISKCIARLYSDGSLDTTFIFDIGASNSVNSCSLQSDGKIIIGGNFTDYNNLVSFRIARLDGGDATGSGCCFSFVNDSIFKYPLNHTLDVVLNYSSNITSARWYWGDSTSTLGFYPTHIYSSPGQYNICVTTYASCSDSITKCFSDSSLIYVNIMQYNPLAIKQYDIKNNQLTVFPNPVSNNLELSFRDYSMIKEINLFDLLGKKILKTQEKNIDVSSLQEGVYFVQVKTTEGILTEKIIVQH